MYQKRQFNSESKRCSPNNAGSDSLFAQLLQEAGESNDEGVPSPDADENASMSSDTPISMDSDGEKLAEEPQGNVRRNFNRATAELSNGRYVCNKCGEELVSNRNMNRHFAEESKCNVEPYLKQR